MDEFLTQLDWLEQHQSPRVVLQFMQAVTEATGRLEKSALVQYQLVDEKRGLRRCRVQGLYWLYYKVKEETEVEVIAFFDTRQNPNKLKL